MVDYRPQLDPLVGVISGGRRRLGGGSWWRRGGGRPGITFSPSFSEKALSPSLPSPPPPPPIWSRPGAGQHVSLHAGEPSQLAQCCELARLPLWGCVVLGRDFVVLILKRVNLEASPVRLRIFWLKVTNLGLIQGSAGAFPSHILCRPTRSSRAPESEC